MRPISIQDAIGRQRGANPAEIPFYQVSKFDLSINLKAAKALGLTVPETLLATAAKVVE